jgi:DNA-binding beta-propeller fold protein YncE
MSLSKLINHGGREKHSLSKALLKPFSLVTATAIGCTSIATSASAATASFSFAFGSAGSGDGEFNFPSGIAVGSVDNIYVTDTSNDRVQVFNPFNFATGIAVDSGDNIYVADADNNRVQVLNFRGVFQSAFGSKGAGKVQFNRLRSITVDNEGDIYVADADNNRVQAFSESQPLVSTPELFGIIVLGILGSGLVVFRLAKRG